MSADRGRITYFAGRKYREVVSQQGRVMLEADLNEAERISTEENRLEALDFVGPAGTPDDGYKVTPGSGGNFVVGKGTMYLGGVRVTLEQDVDYAKQAAAEWMDTNALSPWSEGLYIDPSLLMKQGSVEATLVVREQEISAVEDPALREVALGGPDTAARTRLIQRIVVIPTKSNTCAGASQEAASFWSEKGLIYSPASGALQPRARLQVTPVSGPAPASPCDPPAASGYLGADNQMIRVQVAAVDTKSTGGTLIWGYFNASTLFRATVTGGASVQLDTTPIAPEFEPRSGQVVQILPQTAALGEGAYAAALTGHFSKLTAPYARETRTVTLPGALPAPAYVNGQSVYVRLSEDQTSFTLGTAVALAGTGLEVTITGDPKGRLHVGDYWCIGVRPSTPNEVYPERLKTTPQPPDGPRMWTCPLAVLISSGKSLALADDCRQPFDNLVELTARKDDSCACTVCVSPEQHKNKTLTIQMAIFMVQKAGGGSVCLEPGDYAMDGTLKIASNKGSSLRLIGHERATRLRFRAGDFVIIEGSEFVTLEAFQLFCSNVKAAAAVVIASSLDVTLRALDIRVEGSVGSAVGFAKAVRSVAVRECTLRGLDGVVTLGMIGLGDVILEGNFLECRRIGIGLSAFYDGTQRISDNVITDCADAAIVLGGMHTPTTALDIAHNDIRGVGTGLRVSVGKVRIHGNDLLLKGSGIVLEKGEADVLDEISISNNRIFEAEFGVATREVNLGTVVLSNNRMNVRHTALIVRDSPAVEDMDIDGNQWRAREVAVRIQARTGRVGVRGNLFDVSAGPAVQIAVVKSAKGVSDCIFADNHCKQRTFAKIPVVEISAARAVVTSNRIEGPLLIDVNTNLKQPLCTVVGNITALDIKVNTAPLAAPWVSLNHQL